MSKHILFTSGVLSARYDSDINTVIPAEALEVSDEVFFRTINETDGIWVLENGNVLKLGFPEPTTEEVIANAIALAKETIQGEVDANARRLEFSDGNSLILYAGFPNDFQDLARTFAVWEVAQWRAASVYQTEMLAGTKPIPTKAQILAAMTACPV